MYRALNSAEIKIDITNAAAAAFLKDSQSTLSEWNVLKEKIHGARKVRNRIAHVSLTETVIVDVIF